MQAMMTRKAGTIEAKIMLITLEVNNDLKLGTDKLNRRRMNSPCTIGEGRILRSVYFKYM